MLRLLGILSLGRLLFGGRRRLRRGILLGGLLGFLASRDFDTDRAAEDVRKAAREVRRAARDAAGEVRRAARDAARTARREVREASRGRRTAEIRERIDARRAEREERLRALHAEIEARKARKAEELKAEPEAPGAGQDERVVRALPVSGINEAKEIRELAEDLERDARTAAMAAGVPTIEFPEDDGKYFSSGKYGYA